MRVLFDHNVPRKLSRFLPGHAVTTAAAMGWAELENGELLAAAQREGFEVMVTGDQNLSYQQNLAGRTLAVIVLSTNNWNTIKLNPVPILAALAVVQPGDFRFVAL